MKYTITLNGREDVAYERAKLFIRDGKTYAEWLASVVPYLLSEEDTKSSSEIVDCRAMQIWKVAEIK